jgi:hypothetical protein
VTEPPKSKFQLALERKRATEAAAAAEAEAAKQSFEPDLVPEDEYQRSEGEKALDAFVENISIVDAYNKWCNKMHVSPRPGQRESIKVRCPNPDHEDKGPSAWMNLDKNVLNCRPEGDVGYDSHDIAAWFFGFPVPDYKTNGDFPKLRRMMAEAFGMKVERTLGGQTVAYLEEEPKEDEEEKQETSDKPDKTDISGNAPSEDGERLGDGADRPDATVTELYEEEEQIKLPSLDWRGLLPGADTFLDRYMEATIKDECPEEYHFWNGLLALGFASGRDITLQSKIPVYGNLFLCHLGKTGAGKSTAARHLKRLLRECMPYNHNDPTSNGVQTVTPASAEALIKAFSKPVPDPANMKNIAYYAPVKGLIDYSELSSLIGRGQRVGNILKPTLMDFFDMQHEVRTQSNTGGIILAENPFASCTTSSQPRALRDLLRNSDDASGFLNRWVYVGGAPKQITIMGAGRVDLAPSVDALDRIKGWAGSFTGGKQVEWEEDALEEMQSFFDEYVYPLKNNPDTNIFVRLDLTFLKLTLLFAVNKMERLVTLETVQTVKRMFGYLHACYGIPADQIGNTLENEMTEAIVYQMRRVGGKDGATLNAIALALKRRKYPKELILRNIKALIELGFVEERTNSAGTRGRPTKRYIYVAS